MQYEPHGRWEMCNERESHLRRSFANFRHHMQCMEVTRDDVCSEVIRVQTRSSTDVWDMT